MSTLFWDKITRSADIPYGTQDVVYKGQEEALADFVRRVRVKRGWSLKEVERRSARSGYKIGRTHINRIENGESTNPSPKKLQALAVGLDVPEEDLFARVRGLVRTETTSLEEELISKFRRLPPEWQPGLIVVLDNLLDQFVKPVEERKATPTKPKRRAA